MKLHRKLNWFEVSGLQGRKTNSKLKGYYSVITGKGENKKVFTFYPDGTFLRSEYLSSIKNPVLKKLPAPEWGNMMFEVESNGIGIEGLYDAKTKTIIDFTDYEESISRWIGDLRKSLKDLESLQAIKYL